MSDAWFKEQVAPPEDPEDGCHPEEAQALQKYFDKKTTAKEAARAIVQPILTSEDAGTNLNRLWNLLQTALVDLPASYILPVIDLLKEIQDLPDPDPKSKSTDAANAGKAPTWKGLPGFGNLWADVYKQDNWRNELSQILSSLPDSEGRLKKREELRAFHMKIADIESRLAVADIGMIPLDWGYDAIADALELNNAVIDFELPATKKWMDVAGKELYKGAKEGRKSWALERKRDLGKEEQEMTLERWKFWEGRIREYQRIGELVVQMGTETEEEMKRVREAGM